MKFLYIFFALSLFSCKTTEVSLTKFVSNKTLQTKNCNDKATCTVEVLKNKNYTLEMDSMGKMVPKIIDGDYTVIKYTYKLIFPKGVSDGFESETLHFIVSDTMKKDLLNKELQNIKLIYGKNCFCRDIQGFYKVDVGSFSMDSSQITINFTVPQVGDRQRINTVQLSLN